MRLIDRAAKTAFTGVCAAVASSPLDPDEQRAVSIYLLVTVCNVPGAVAATAANCTRQNVSKLVRAVEDGAMTMSMTAIYRGSSRFLE